MAKKAGTASLEGEIFLRAESDGLSATACRGDGSVLFAFNLEERPATTFAGFAVKRTPPNAKPAYLLNRLNFSTAITRATTPGRRRWTPSDKAPFQKFRWADFPPMVQPGAYTYDITAMYFKDNGGLKRGPTVQLTFDMAPESFGNFEMGFTRGYLSSQAYADRFQNAAIRPKGKRTIDFDTAPFGKRYEWLGSHARQMVFDFLREVINDKAITMDVFAYDLDEPDIIRCLAKLGTRLRLFLDNAALHTKRGAVEPLVRELIEESAGSGNVRVGHFRRFAHHKVFIQKRGGKAVKVLTGSANFSVRGLYVQANNVLLFNDATVAGLFQRAFDQAFDDPASFADADIAKGWHEIKVDGCPDCLVAFSPHKDHRISLARVAEEIKNADHSVLFAIMELGGSGPVLDRIRELDTTQIFSYGVTQSGANLNFFKPGSKSGKFVSFAYLKDKVPEPFKKEWSGGQGQVVHHKFVVVDFHDSDPVVFTGSSNLAAGGEESNGDNLFAIYDRGIATAYAVEAIRLLDHYHFRIAMQKATQAKPLMLQPADAKPKWWEPYYDESHIKYRERLLFSK
jgi:phosphatidylserine/phosphatidylglycerophosphate/cardiolipin synthase-like enzyme